MQLIFQIRLIPSFFESSTNHFSVLSARFSTHYFSFKISNYLFFMQDNQNKVIDWIRSGMDYNEGIGLLVELTRKQLYSDQFTGREKSMADKLAYEIYKMF
ncbi:MAG: hypothetical protein NTY07_07765 [Bacteroidia bacterium]|nr:hypothetical protein [Bacteroidia bacterium]